MIKITIIIIKMYCYYFIYRRIGLYIWDETIDNLKGLSDYLKNEKGI